jgi:hypothetical protein
VLLKALQGLRRGSGFGRIHNGRIEVAVILDECLPHDLLIAHLHFGLLVGELLLLQFRLLELLLLPQAFELQKSPHGIERASLLRIVFNRRTWKSAHYPGIPPANCAQLFVLGLLSWFSSINWLIVFPLLFSVLPSAL